MTSIYLSSTALDLGAHRQAVIDVLAKCGYDVDAMENYYAREERPRDACEKESAKRDIYVGLFAWRYGFVPQTDNPEERSITELEYLSAGRASKSRLIFLLADDAPWPNEMKDLPGDKSGIAIRRLRTNFATDHWMAPFSTPENLANKVITSVFQLEATRRAERLDAADRLQTVPYLGESYLVNIREMVQQLSGAKFVVLRLGPTPWWNTRLHLVSALASDFTEMSQLILLDEEGQLVAMAGPAEVRSALAKSDARLELTYLQARQNGAVSSGSEIERVIVNYGTALATIFGQEETAIVEVLTPRRLRELGIRTQGEAMEIGDASLASIRGDLLLREKPYVVLMRDGQLEGIVDRLTLATRIAALALR